MQTILYTNLKAVAWQVATSSDLKIKLICLWFPCVFLLLFLLFLLPFSSLMFLLFFFISFPRFTTSYYHLCRTTRVKRADSICQTGKGLIHEDNRKSTFFFFEGFPFLLCLTQDGVLFTTLSIFSCYAAVRPSLLLE